MNYDELVKSLRNVADNSHYTSPELLKDAADAIEELQAQLMCSNETAKAIAEKLPRWISVKERLPETRDFYLAFTTKCETYVCDFIPSVKQWWTEPGDNWIMNVTHWMPRPTPPQEIPEMPEMREMGKIAEDFFGKWVEE